jgi:hypothetical protein
MKKPPGEKWTIMPLCCFLRTTPASVLLDPCLCHHTTQPPPEDFAKSGWLPISLRHHPL